MLMLLLCHQLLFIHWNLHILRYFSKFFDFYVERIFDASLYYLKALYRFSSPIILNTVKMANMLRTAFCNKINIIFHTKQSKYKYCVAKIQIQIQLKIWGKHMDHLCGQNEDNEGNRHGDSNCNHCAWDYIESLSLMKVSPMMMTLVMMTRHHW